MLKEQDFALHWLRHVCLPDPEYALGRVHSIYFDTPRLASLKEKVDGDFLKTKVRLRWYDEDNPVGTEEVNAFLEVKTRFGSGRRKIRRKLPMNRNWLENCSLDDDGLLHVLYRHGGDFDGVTFTHLLPVLTVVYDRYRFVCPFTGARICLDTSIQSDRVNLDVLPAPVLSTFVNAVVLEIKDVGHVEIPWMENLVRTGFRSSSFSKYAMCLSQVIQGVVS